MSIIGIMGAAGAGNTESWLGLVLAVVLCAAFAVYIAGDCAGLRDAPEDPPHPAQGVFDRFFASYQPTDDALVKREVGIVGHSGRRWDTVPRMTGKSIENRDPALVQQILDLYAQGHSAKAVAAEVGVNHKTVLALVTRRGVSRKQTRAVMWVPAPAEVEAVRRAYIGGQTPEAIGAVRGQTGKVVRRVLRDAGVVLRGRSASQVEHHAQRQDPVFPPNLIPLLDGLLLGDGSLHQKRPGQAVSYRQTSVSPDWLDEIEYAFHGAGLAMKRRLDNRKDRNPAEAIRTPALYSLREQYVRWCPGGVRDVPAGVDLSPVSVRAWLLGDGHRYGSGLRICCESFTPTRVDYLRDRLGAMGFASRHTSGNRLTLRREPATALYKYARKAGPPPATLAYRWVVGSGDSECSLA